ncbi:MAG: DUF5685 family protein [Eubacterium sp.]|nr:DUF5685 family protein [Eubacterium sp.]
MFGYLTVDPSELKGKDMERYRAYYCGLCQDLKFRFGQRARATLTYDMTFLSILLSSLYKDEAVSTEVGCILHPGRKRTCIRNEYSAYAADMNVLLVYYNLMDDWLDEKKVSSRNAAAMLKKKALQVENACPEQAEAVRTYLEKLHKGEEDFRTKPPGSRREAIERVDYMASLTGRLFARIYQVKKDDLWSRDLALTGFGIGRFIYLTDAWDDLEKDRKKGNYNPFLPLVKEADYEALAADMLKGSAALAARGFERLPIVENVDILRDILYSGIWVRYRQKREKETK